MKTVRFLLAATALLPLQSALALPSLPTPIVTGSAVPAAPVVKAYTGEAVIGGTGSAVYGKFGVPQPDAVAGTVVNGKKKTPAIFSQATEVVFEKGSNPNLAAFPNATASLFLQPNGDGTLLLIRDPQDGVGSANGVLLVNGLTNGVPAVLARTGTPGNGLPPGVVIRRFLAFDDTGTDPFFLAQLSGTGVARGDQLALCSVTGTTVNVLLQKGDAALGSTVTGFSTLVGARGTLADGRWRVDDADFGALLTLADHRRAAVIIPATSTSGADFTELQETGTGTVAETGTASGIAGSSIATLGLPGFGTTSVASVCLLKSGTAGAAITGADNVALITSASGSATSTVLARKGQVINSGSGTPISGVFYSSFAPPVTGAGGAVAFEATVRGSGVKSSNRVGIWYASDGATPELVARTGDAAATSGTATGGHYASFRSLSLPSATTGTGPIFLATLRVNKSDGVTARNNLGLYALDSTGTVDLLMRSGQTVTIPSSATPKTIRSFVTLVPALGSVGAQSTSDNTGKITVAATFTDKSQALLKITVP